VDAPIEDGSPVSPAPTMRRRHRRRSLAAAVVVALALVAAACSSSGSSSSTATTVAAARIPFTAAKVVQDGATYTVSWESPGDAGVTVYAGTDPENVGTTRQVGTGDATGTITVSDLPDAPRWYFELVPAEGDPLVVADRSLHLASAPNFRDVGGYRTTDGRWVEMGKLYRADSLAKLTAEDTAKLQAIGVKLVCDLRTDYERTQNPDVTIPGSEAIQLNVAADGADLTKQITDAILTGDAAAQQEILGNGKGKELMITGGSTFVTSPAAQAAYTTMYERIADPANLATVFHCSAGKDRTGWAAASFLTMLGVPQDVVFSDYLLSNDYLAASNEATLAKTKAIIDPALLEPVIGVAPEYLQASFDTVQSEYGGIDGYLTDGLGLSQATIDQIKSEFLAG
jgi:protein-tyrosine phosphatase